MKETLDDMKQKLKNSSKERLKNIDNKQSENKNEIDKRDKKTL